MLYPVYVRTGDAQQAHGVTFPDFPGCFAAADDWAGLPAAIQEAVQAHFHGEGAEAVPEPTALEVLATDPQYSGGVWLLADVDLSWRQAPATEGRPLHRIPDLIRARLTRDRPMTTLTVAIPVNVIESMKRVAERRGLGGYEALLKWYLSDGLRRDEADMLREEAEPPGPPR